MDFDEFLKEEKRKEQKDLFDKMAVSSKNKILSQVSKIRKNSQEEEDKSKGIKTKLKRK